MDGSMVSNLVDMKKNLLEDKMILKERLQSILKGEDEKRINEMLEVLENMDVVTEHDLIYLNRSMLEMTQYFQTIEIKKIISNKPVIYLRQALEYLFPTEDVSNLEAMEEYFLKNEVFTSEDIALYNLENIAQENSIFTERHVTIIKTHAEKAIPEITCEIKKIEEHVRLKQEILHKTNEKLDKIRDGYTSKYLWYKLLERLLLGSIQFYILLIVTGGLPNLISCDPHHKCQRGDNVHFECPCCPEEFEHCKFKKLFQEGYIFRNGILDKHSMNKYEVDELKTQLTLKGCDEDDGGVYIWMCGKCNVNKQFNLEVYEDKSEFLKCFSGAEVHFNFPRCADGLDSCTFKNNRGEHVQRGGIMSHHHSKYMFVKNHIILKHCDKTDEGMYVWTCEKCNVKIQFHVEIHLPESAIARSYNETHHERNLHGKSCGISNAYGTLSFSLILLSLILQKVTN